MAVRRTRRVLRALELLDGVPPAAAEADEHVGEPAKRPPAIFGRQRLGQRPDHRGAQRMA